MAPMIDDIRMNKAAPPPQPATATKKLDAHVLLDRSGSMMSIRDRTVEAINEYFGSLAAKAEADHVDTTVSLTIFDDHSIDLIRDRQPVKLCGKLAADEFVPRGQTPLNDAIGKTAARIESQPRRENESVAFVILTDGHENASREYSKADIKALLERCQKDLNWLVLFLGANQDAFAEGVTGRGTLAANTMSYDTGNISASMRSAARSSHSHGLVGDHTHASVGFTDAERAEAMAADDEEEKRKARLRGAH